jgi:putative pyoverdin transport system ATP-binding/permease protein
VNFVLQFYRQSWRLLFFSVVTGLAAGLSGAATIAVIGKVISGEGKSLMLEMIFVGLCVTRFVCKSGSELALLRISQALVLQLRVSLSRKLLVTPQKKLQALGKPGLLTILTDDIATFAQCAQLLPLMFSNAVLVIACLSYIGWLSWHILLLVLLFLVFSASAFKWAERTPLRRFSEVREEMEVLYKNFRSLIEGSKELQLNKERGNFFLDHVLRNSAAAALYAWHGGLHLDR